MRVRAGAAALVFVATAALSGPLAATAATAAPAVAAPPCTALAYPPSVNSHNRTIVGTGTGYGCTNATKIRVTLMQYRKWWWDRELATKEQTMTGIGPWGVVYHCNGTGHQAVYTKVNHGGKEHLSANVAANFCG